MLGIDVLGNPNGVASPSPRLPYSATLGASLVPF
jgi:hypothetical protein